MEEIVDFMDKVLSATEDAAIIKAVREKVNKTMSDYPLFAY